VVISKTSANTTISASEALESLRLNGLLSDVTVTGDLDLSTLGGQRRPADAFRIEGVVFTDDVSLARAKINVPLRIRRSRFESNLVLHDRCSFLLDIN